MIAPPDPDDLARVKAWFERLSSHVRAVDYAGARPIFADNIRRRARTAFRRASRA
jgi:hypothetical protein